MHSTCNAVRRLLNSGYSAIHGINGAGDAVGSLNDLRELGVQTGYSCGNAFSRLLDLGHLRTHCFHSTRNASRCLYDLRHIIIHIGILYLQLGRRRDDVVMEHQVIRVDCRDCVSLIRNLLLQRCHLPAEGDDGRVDVGDSGIDFKNLAINDLPVIQNITDALTNCSAVSAATATSGRSATTA